MDVRGRRRARRALVQAVYQWQMNQASAPDLILEFRNSGALKKADHPFFYEMLSMVIAQCNALDDLYEDLLDRPKARLDNVELAILRLGACELHNRPDVPGRVVLNEYIELAKLFGAQDSYKYINGLLDKLANHLRSEELSS